MYAVLPKKAKPSKSISKDATRPHLARAELIRRETTEDGETNERWWLVATDSYQLVHVPLDVRESAGSPLALEEGCIPADALKEIEKAGAFRANGTIEPVDPDTGEQVGASFQRRTDEHGRFPNVDNLQPNFGETVYVRFDASLLWAMAQSFGITPSVRPGARAIELELSADELAKASGYCRPIIVHHAGNDGHGLLMPVRRS